MSDFIRKKSVNKFYISIPNCHTVNELKLKVSGLYSSLCDEVFTNFPEKILVVGGKQKRATKFFTDEVTKLKQKYTHGGGSPLIIEPNEINLLRSSRKLKDTRECYRSAKAVEAGTSGKYTNKAGKGS